MPRGAISFFWTSVIMALLYAFNCGGINFGLRSLQKGNESEREPVFDKKDVQTDQSAVWGKAEYFLRRHTPLHWLLGRTVGRQKSKQMSKADVHICKWSPQFGAHAKWGEQSVSQRISKMPTTHEFPSTEAIMLWPLIELYVVSHIPGNERWRRNLKQANTGPFVKRS